MLGKSFLLSLLFCFTIANQAKFNIYDPEIQEIELNSTGQYQQFSDESLLWGPYRSSLYFGIRPRIPKSLLSGLMWYQVNDYTGLGNVRHFYEQQENMKHANWVKYDPRYGGRQVIDDDDCHTKIIIDFVKTKDGKSWAVKVRTKPYKGFEKTKIAFVWYSGLEGKKESPEGVMERTGFLKLENTRDPRGFEGTVNIAGLLEDLGFFELDITDGPSTNKHPSSDILYDPELDPSKAHHYSLTIEDDNVWKAKDIFLIMLQESIKGLVDQYEKPDEFPPEQAYILRDLQGFEGNMHFVQKIYEGACEFDIIYSSASTPVTEKITPKNIGQKIKSAIGEFDTKFSQHFTLSSPYNEKKYENFAKEALSGLLGGLSYSHGDHLVDRDTVFDEESFENQVLEGELEGPFELFTLVPSRPFFPRGFLWDEGFHLLPLLDYDSDLVLEIMKSWFNLIDDDGWVAREQILGPEARSRVPAEFQVQSPLIVNPPTLMLAFTFLVDSIKTQDLETPLSVDASIDKSNLGQIVVSNPQLLLDYVKQVYPKLKAHYKMFRRTQRGHVAEFERGENTEAYRWRGRTETHCLASGLDDYPRCEPDIAELNVDLLSWIGVMTRAMKQLAKICDYAEDIEELNKIEHDIIENLDKLHWSEEANTYCDLSVDEDDENQFICHKGYISLFPFVTKMIPENQPDKIRAMVDLIRDPEELWTDFGVRSLSKSDAFYMTATNYWRSPIWINLNYLILESLQHYRVVTAGELSEKIAETYAQLRLNLVNNVYDKWDKSGYVWEHYDDITGVEKGAKNFLGWSSSVILMMKMPESI